MTQDPNFYIIIGAFALTCVALVSMLSLRGWRDWIALKRELICQLDAQQFWQIHRSTIVNLSAIAAVQRDEMGRQRVNLKQHKEVLEVSRSFGHVFKHQ